MDSDELIVNIQCIEHGIVPIAGVEHDHVVPSLSSLPDNDRRACTRKFRKLLKKAIAYFASLYYEPGSHRHRSYIEDQRKLAGLDNKNRGQFFTKGQSSFRKLTVQRYLSYIETETE